MSNQYLAGLFDGEGCVTYSNNMVKRKGKKKAYPTWNIRLEVNMTHKETIQYLLDTFGCGHMNFRAKAPHQTMDQWRWRCSHRDALYCAKRMFPHSITKKEKLESIIKHYEIKDSRSL